MRSRSTSEVIGRGAAAGAAGARMGAGSEPHASVLALSVSCPRSLQLLEGTDEAGTKRRMLRRKLLLAGRRTVACGRPERGGAKLQPK